MIQYALSCENGHSFDAWFRNAAAYDEQAARGIVTCPICGGQKIAKAPMAPAVARSSSKKSQPADVPVPAQVPAPASAADKVAVSGGHPQQAEVRAAMKQLRDKVVAEADYVGDQFAAEARKMHDKEIEPRGIYGEATREEVSGLIEDGIEFMPLPVLPEDHN